MTGTYVLHRFVPALEPTPAENAKIPVVGNVFDLDMSPKAALLSEGTP
jgi:hypothetical protein